jgi:hypothetical protein
MPCITISPIEKAVMTMVEAPNGIYIVHEAIDVVAEGHQIHQGDIVIIQKGQTYRFIHISGSIINMVPAIREVGHQMALKIKVAKLYGKITIEAP